MIGFWVLFVSFFVLNYASCPEGTIEWHNSCYLFQSNLTSFTNAEFACNHINGHLASVHDGFVNALLAAQGALYFESTVNDFWIGLNTLMTLGNWSWIDQANYNFSDWAPSEPKNMSMNCAVVTIANGLWKAEDCFKAKPFVCKVSQVFTPTTVSYPDYVNCSYGWHYFEPTQSCYGKNEIELIASDWTNAEKHCERQNAHLVSLHSYEETKFLSFLTEQTSYLLWTGLYSNDNEVSWKWSDDSSLDYLPWASGYPKRNISSCVYLGYEQIVDDDCSRDYYEIICKKPAPM